MSTGYSVIGNNFYALPVSVNFKRPSQNLDKSKELKIKNTPNQDLNLGSGPDRNYINKTLNNLKYDTNSQILDLKNS
jgi:hypothetical protein